MKTSKKNRDDFKLPDGNWMSLWASSDRDISPWTFFWEEFEANQPPKAWYRVGAAGKLPGEWKPMKSAEAVFKQTGFDDDPDTLSDPDDELVIQLAAAEKLPKGRYVVQVKIQFARKDVELGGVTFSVK